MLIGMRDQWIAEMEAAEENSGPGSSVGYDGHDRDAGDDSEVDGKGSGGKSLTYTLSGRSDTSQLHLIVPSRTRHHHRLRQLHNQDINLQ